MVMQYGETLTTPPVTNAAKALEKVVEQPEETFTETVVIATDTNNTTTYIVQAKEGLYSIAKKFNTTVDALKKLNDLKDNNISIGQVLKIK
jgi:LysM repeat protein